MAARLLDAADKVPSFCLEQKFAPEESEFRSPMGGGLGLQRGPPSWLPSSSARKALGRVLPRPHPRPAGPAPPAPPRRPQCTAHLLSGLFGKQPLLSTKEETANVLFPGARKALT